MQKKNGQAETKPFTNFSVFHDNLITRLKALSHIQTEFEKRVKDADQRYSDKLADMRKQLDLRWKQIDKFEASVKTLAEAKAVWRKKLSAKDGEIEALQVRWFRLFCWQYGWACSDFLTPIWQFFCPIWCLVTA